jgi:hypothetical protein
MEKRWNADDVTAEVCGVGGVFRQSLRRILTPYSRAEA